MMENNSFFNGSNSDFNNIFPTYISENNPKYLEIDDKYIGGLVYIIIQISLQI